MKRIILLGSMALFLTSCQRGCASWNISVQVTDKTYIIESYSGGKLVYKETFDGILNNQENSDGYYFYKGDTLIEVGGDIIVKSVN